MKTDVKITPPKPETLDAIRGGDATMFRKLLARTWLEQQGDTSLEFAVPGSRVRHSWAGKCARALRYEIDGVKPSNPPDVAAHWVFRLGHLIHDEIQGTLQAMFPDCQIEVKRANPAIDGSCHIDAEIQWFDYEKHPDVDQSPGEIHVVEIKSIGGYAFKKKNGARGHEPPKHSELLQLALNAKATPGCTGGWLIHASKENTSIGEAERHGLGVLDRFLWVEWYPIEDLRPLAELEEKRIRQVLAEADEEAEARAEWDKADDEAKAATPFVGVKTPRIIPDPEIPAGAVIINPAKNQWALHDPYGNIVDTGTTWVCDYCDHLATCLGDGE